MNPNNASRTVIKDIEFEPCKDDYFGKEAAQYNYLNLTNNAYCLTSNSEEVKIRGTFESEEYNRIDIKISKCNNGS